MSQSTNRRLLGRGILSAMCVLGYIAGCSKDQKSNPVAAQDGNKTKSGQLESDATTERAEGPKATPGKLDRTVLPIQAPKHDPITEVDARKAKAPPRFEVKAPKDAPNVVIVLIDDIGFGTATSFGGAVRTPTLDRLGKNGLRYNQFHTTALCSPTRMAILTGRNHHSANCGSVQEVATV